MSKRVKCLLGMHEYPAQCVDGVLSCKHCSHVEYVMIGEPQVPSKESSAHRRGGGGVLK